ncbi:MAG: SseB family protein [Sinomonas sp.]|nr:SseB family protein [Sinomonas sp.]
MSDHPSQGTADDGEQIEGGQAEGGRGAAGEQPPSSGPQLDPTPLNPLEEALRTATESGTEDDGRNSVLAFLNSIVCLLVPEPVPGQTEYVEPLVLTNAEGKPLVAAFTDRARIRPDFLEHAPTVVTTQGAVLLQNLGEELGLVLNPGAAFGFELSSEHVKTVLRDFRPVTPEELADGETGE